MQEGLFSAPERPGGACTDRLRLRATGVWNGNQTRPARKPPVATSSRRQDPLPWRCVPPSSRPVTRPHTRSSPVPARFSTPAACPRFTGPSSCRAPPRNSSNLDPTVRTNRRDERPASEAIASPKLDHVIGARRPTRSSPVVPVSFIPASRDPRSPARKSPGPPISGYVNRARQRGHPCPCRPLIHPFGSTHKRRSPA